MNRDVQSKNEVEQGFAGEMSSLSAGSALGTAARAALVNRTHRVVRERATAMRARKTVTRSLWIPLGISAGLLAAVVFAIWTVLDEYNLAPTELSTTGLPDASQQIFVLLMWCVPISLAALAVVLFRRSSAAGGSGNEGAQ